MGLAFWRLQHEKQLAALAEATPEEKPRVEAAISPLKALERPSPEPEAKEEAPAPEPVQEASSEASAPESDKEKAMKEYAASRRASVRGSTARQK